MQLSALIEHLTSLRAAIGADVPVRIAAYTDGLFDVSHVREAHVGRADRNKLVSRGGISVVLIVCE